jgi:hypothetical protein
MPVKSENQRKAMWAAEEGHSTLGIPKSVAEKFVGPNAHDMTPDNWKSLVGNMRKFFAEEADEGEHDDLDLGQLRDTLTKFFKEEEAEPEHAEDDFPIGAVLRRRREPPAQDELPLLAFLEQVKPPPVLGLDSSREVGTPHKMAFDKRSVRSYDRDGQMHVERTPIAKANVCEYFGKEIPLPYYIGDEPKIDENKKPIPLDPERKYRLLRDPKELEAATKTANGKQLLIQHVPVDADDHQPDITVGAVGTTAEYEHPYVYNGLTVHAREGIDGIENNNRRQISPAYHYKADMTPGEYEGEKFDGVMRGIEFNHFCLVPEGRQGNDVIVQDQAPPRHKFNLSVFAGAA